LADKGIATSVHFKPLNTMTYYATKYSQKCPTSEQIYSKIVSLPLYPAMSDEEINYILSTILEIME
jgi:dTDP-4-amino-4,6-dideoxygalactose transaminase